MIYHSLWEDVRAGDRHSAKISENKAGILRGADFKEQARVINRDQREEIKAIVARAETFDFRPLLFVIPYARVSRLLRHVAVDQRAHPLSTEFIIERLPSDRFDVIELRRFHV